MKLIGRASILFSAAFLALESILICAGSVPASGQAFRLSDSLHGGSLLTVLCYHHVDCSVRTEYSVTSAQLNQQIDSLIAAGFIFVSSAQVEAFYTQGTPLPMKSALITFDDGNRDVYEHGYPLLLKRGIPFTFFVYPSAVNKGHSIHCVSWDDLKEMAANGVTVGCHARTHPLLTQPPRTVTTRAGYDAWLEKEMVEARAEIEKKLGFPVTEFAVPFGAFDGYVYEKIKAAGYSLSFSVHGAAADSRSDRWNINRVIVRASMSRADFLELAASPPLFFSSNDPRDLSRVDMEKTFVSFILDDVQAIDEGSVQSKISSFQGLELHHVTEGDRFIEQIDLRRPAIYTVHVTANDKLGRLCRGGWIFIYEKTVPNFLER